MILIKDMPKAVKTGSLFRYLNFYVKNSYTDIKGRLTIETKGKWYNYTTRTTLLRSRDGVDELYKLLGRTDSGMSWLLKNIKTGETKEEDINLRYYYFYRTFKEAKAEHDRLNAIQEEIYKKIGFRLGDYIRVKNPLEYIFRIDNKCSYLSALLSGNEGYTQQTVFKVKQIHDRGEYVTLDIGYKYKSELFEYIAEKDIQAEKDSYTSLNKKILLRKLKDNINKKINDETESLTSQFLALSVAYRKHNEKKQNFFSDTGEQVLSDKIDEIEKAVNTLTKKGIVESVNFNKDTLKANIYTNTVKVTEIYDFDGSYMEGNEHLTYEEVLENNIIKEPFDIGKFEMRIDFVDNDIKIFRYGNDNFYGNHPHINQGTGRVCFGTLQEEIFKALRDIDLEYLVTALLGGLEKINIGDTLQPYAYFTRDRGAEYVNV